MVRRLQLRPTLTVGLSQRLAMTPSLLQKIELLTLSRLELSDMLQQELSENPVLEETQESEAPAEKAGDAAPAAESGDSSDQTTDQREDFDYEYFFGEYLNSSGTYNREREFDEDRPSFDLFLASQSTLNDHLNWQLNLADIDARLHEICYFIIGNINQNGLLTLNDEEIASAVEVSLEEVEKAVAIVQGLDPIGVGARDIRECLLLQLRADGLGDTLVERLVECHLELVQAKKLKEIAREEKCSIEEVAEALQALRRFTPDPGQEYGSQPPQYIQPDVHIAKVNGEYQSIMNDDGLPKLRLNWAYRQMLKDATTSKETKSFIKEKVRSAMELLKSVDQRQQTINRVCQVIVSRQVGFLDSGLMHLEPMLIKDVAEELGVHSSTISRVVANKYAHTPQGVIELRRFFTVGIESFGGEIVSIVRVKDRIRKIIDGEDQRKPLSDQRITAILNREGIQITRRTVAKYRDQMNIAGSRERRMVV